MTRRRENQLEEKHFKISNNDTGHSYESLFGDYLEGVREVVVEDPHIQATHQIQNFVHLCELLARRSIVKKIKLLTRSEYEEQQDDIEYKLTDLVESLRDIGITLKIEFNHNMHDREIWLSNGWTIKIGRGLDIYKKPQSWSGIGAHDLHFRHCRETKVDIFKRHSRTSGASV